MPNLTYTIKVEEVKSKDDDEVEDVVKFVFSGRHFAHECCKRFAWNFIGVFAYSP